MICPCFINFLLFVSSCVIFAVIFTLFILKKVIRMMKNKNAAKSSTINVAIFHPYCNAGGGGERVLWAAIRAIQNKYKDVEVHLYTGDVEATPQQILSKCRNNFNISVDPKRLHFVYLKKRRFVEASKYPHFTLLGQSLGSMFLAFEALLKFQPDIFIDTMGYAFTYPVFKYFGGCKIGCYTHYPTISIDMLRRVANRIVAHNNKTSVAKNPFLTHLKLAYYRFFAWVYSVVGRCADTIMVNSSWTENHIVNLWNVPFKTHRVYPPCEVSHLKKIEHLPSSEGKIYILSVGQYRPEKDHPLLLQGLYELRTLLANNEELWNRIRLVFVGSCRNQEDTDRVKNMVDLSKHLSLENNVEFKVNVSYQELVQCYQKSLIGLHGMWNEHFGISVVDCMAAGLIMIANRSGGPQMDIIETSEGSQNGFLAVEPEDYAQCIATILYNTKEQNNEIRNNARASVDRFSEKEFDTNFLRATANLFE